MLIQPAHFRGNNRQRRVLALLLALCTLLALVPVSGLADETGVVTATELFLRSGPSTDAEKIRTLQEGWKVTILGKSGDWYQVEYKDVVGYAAAKYISKGGGSSKSSSESSSSSGSGGKDTIASLGKAPSPCKPGDTNNSVLKIQQALTILGYYSGNQSGNYGDLTEKAVKEFQKAKGLSADGIAGKGTIKAIFGVAPGKSSGSSSGSSDSKSSSSSTERLDWFNGGRGTIPKGGVFQIKDVRSGRVFKARHWAGTNHMDAEPYTKDDTDKLKACYGGRFSWNRRPILVKYNGHVYAASMNGMPHGSDDTIPNNGFDGVFCVHFYKCKTHGSDKVDSDHQACIKEAMNASW